MGLPKKVLQQMNTTNSSVKFNGFYTGSIIFVIFILTAVIAPLCGSKGDWHLLPLVGLIIAFPMFCRIRIDDACAVLYFGIFPSRINIREVVALRFVTNNPQYPEAPVIVYFDLVNGKTKRWELNFFPITMRQEIRIALEQRIKGTPLSSKVPKNEALEKWTASVSKSNKAEKIIFFVAMTFMYLLALLDINNQRNWDQKVNTWDHIQGVIQRNTTKRVRSGKSTKEVSVVEYQYTYKGKYYTGNKIAYDSDHFPHYIQPGTSREIIVNPQKPAESAVMVYFRNKVFSRYFKTIVIAIIGTFFFLLLLKTKMQKKPIVPEKLVRYMASVPPADLKGNIQNTSTGELLSKPQFLEERYCILSRAPSLKSFLWLLPFLLFLPGLIVPGPSMGVKIIWGGMAFFWSIGAFFALYPQKTILDFQEKKIFFKRLKKKTVSFADWEYLYVRKLAVNKEGFRIFLAGGKKGSSLTPICHLPISKLQTLLVVLPELAQKMGKLPIVFK